MAPAPSSSSFCFPSPPASSLRPWIGDWALRHKTLLGLVDRGSILLVVYAAFSEGVTQGIWRQLDLADLGRLVAVDGALLAAVLAITTYGSRLLGFSRADEVTIVFCGSKKSLASGLPMATVLLAGQSVGLIVLPLMLFHQIQLMVCAALAKRYANAASAPRGRPPTATAHGRFSRFDASTCVPACGDQPRQPLKEMRYESRDHRRRRSRIGMRNRTCHARMRSRDRHHRSNSSESDRFSYGHSVWRHAFARGRCALGRLIPI